MANNTWTNAGAPTNDYSVAGSWSLGTVPVATNSVFVVDGSGAITAGLAQGAVTLVDFTVGPLYTGSQIGASVAAPLVISASGRVSLKPGTYTNIYLQAGAGNINVVYIEMASAQQKVYLVAGTFGTVHVRRGNVIVVGATYTKLIIDPVNADPTNVLVELQGGTIAEAECNNAGYFTSGTGPTITLHTAFDSNSTLDQGTATTIRLWGQSTFRHRAATNITLIDTKPGSSFLADEDQRPKTVTNATKYPGASMAFSPNVILTNPVKDPLGAVVLSYSNIDTGTGSSSGG